MLCIFLSAYWHNLATKDSEVWTGFSGHLKAVIKFEKCFCFVQLLTYLCAAP